MWGDCWAIPHGRLSTGFIGMSRRDWVGYKKVSVPDVRGVW
jgi:hypothetical protein